MSDFLTTLATLLAPTSMGAMKKNGLLGSQDSSGGLLGMDDQGVPLSEKGYMKQTPQQRPDAFTLLGNMIAPNSMKAMGANSGKGGSINGG